MLLKYIGIEYTLMVLSSLTESWDPNGNGVHIDGLVVIDRRAGIQMGMEYTLMFLSSLTESNSFHERK